MMKYLKLFEDFNEKSKDTEINIDRIVDCITRGGVIYASAVKNFPENDGTQALKPLSVDEDGLVTVEYNGQDYEVDIKNIEKIDYN